MDGWDGWTDGWMGGCMGGQTGCYTTTHATSTHTKKKQKCSHVCAPGSLSGGSLRAFVGQRHIPSHGTLQFPLSKGPEQEAIAKMFFLKRSLTAVVCLQVSKLREKAQRASEVGACIGWWWWCCCCSLYKRSSLRLRVQVASASNRRAWLLSPLLQRMDNLLRSPDLVQWKW